MEHKDEKKPIVRTDLHVYVGVRQSKSDLSQSHDIIIAKSLESAINKILEDDRSLAERTGIVRDAFLAKETKRIERYFPGYKFTVRDVSDCFVYETSKLKIFTSEEVFPEITVASSYKKAYQKLESGAIEAKGILFPSDVGFIARIGPYDIFITRKKNS
ncbi:hypothetical protein JW756_04575 [Candidatus Woesearchaeota archaeon]|nr:hypothetical protein [Candidatus Woesearchaeota archaeon]